MLFPFARVLFSRDTNVAFANCYGDPVQNSAMTCTERVGSRMSGKAFEITGVDIETIVDGKITEHDGAEDMLSLLQQISAVPITFR
jgi:hypothetical protein